MKNIWYIFSISIFTIIGLIIIGIILYIKKEKFYIISEIIILLFTIFICIDSVPFVQDVVYQETSEVVVTYIECQRGNVDPGAYKFIFKSDTHRYEFIAPKIIKLPTKIEIGKKYKIEYYVNSKVIKEYILIDER